tara:strand:+ start:3258 stop:3809 length:552 start_codon:yes stop_codon:yes gene_type:complete
MAINSTIISKRKICKTCKKSQFLFSHGNCKQCATVKSTSNRAEKLEEQDEDISFQQLIADNDEVFSKLIRVKYADKDGMVKCYTSDVLMRWQDSQCGHFIGRSHLATRWMEDNCRVQSAYDNCNLHGNLEVFKKRLEAEKSGITDFLVEQSRQVTKIGVTELKELLVQNRFRLKLLMTKFSKK